MSDTTENVAQRVAFHDLALLCERISVSAKGGGGKSKLFTSFLQHWRNVHATLHADEAQTDDSFYPAMRLILPHLDRQRLAYGMKEVVLAKCYIEVLGIAKESEDAQKLLKYRAPQTTKQDAGDFATVAFYVLKNRCPDKGRLSIAEVNASLDDLALSNVKKDKGGMKKSLQTLLRNLSALEQKWLIRIILKNMMMGMNENSVFSAFHPDALDLHNVCTNLEKVCKDLRDPSVRLIDSEITLFSSFRPMLAARASINHVEKLMDHKPFYVEIKYDGDRMQLHKNGDNYMYFSRSGKDYTHSFGSTPKEGSFTPAIHKSFSTRVQSCILDGEMVGYDLVNDCFRFKGENVDVKTLDEADIGINDL
jgi:DNA ligase-4